MVSPADLPGLFLKFDYPEARDLAKAFLGLNAAVLVFTLTFSDRVVGLAPGYRPAKVAMIGAWSVFLVAVAAIGAAIGGLVLAGGRAVYGGDFEGEAQRSYALLVGAGLLFIVGLSAMVAAAVLKMRLREEP
ncbi:hypothetical protein [Phenylobacterium sp.]|jgi:hypothetical protein|uniref:hypothetical protein n=1 Tax=Phenylobacterium sp. TaxID=1871053 RepID=UPI002F40B36A